MTFDLATCARLPAEALASLASLRGSEGISVVLDGESAWVFWDSVDVGVLRAVLPVPGVELFENRIGDWYKTGQRLPCFTEGPPSDRESIRLSRAVTPEPFRAEMPADGTMPSLPLRLVRDGRPRPTTAAICPLEELGRWADSALSSEIAAIRGAVQGSSALLLGRTLPLWPGATRYWGVQVLVPIGFVIRPDLPEATILEALGSPGREILRVMPESQSDRKTLAVESIPLDALRPLSRAGIRLARVGATSL